jgi:acetyl esterase/lipase
MRSLVALALGASLLAGCTVPRPPGDGSLRYRDPVFSSVNVTNDLTYGASPGTNPVTLELDLYQPAGDTLAKRPALVWVHGGGFTMGDKASARSKAATPTRLRSARTPRSQPSTTRRLR